MLKTRDEVALLCVCAVVILSPALILGFPAGHDGSFHARAWLAVAESWREGVVLPQWAQSFAYSFGEPVFTFYPPVSWALGGLMIVLVGYSFAAMAYSAVVLLTAGVAMRACAREALLGRYALLASCMYMGNPYMIISLYQRNAFSEALAGAIFPLVFMYAWRLRLQPLAALPLAICVGVIWLTSVPGALIMTYIVVILAALVCVVERRVSVLALATGALGAAVGLASIYLWPAFRQQDLVQLGMLTSAFFEPEKNFPVRWAMDPVSGLFPRLLCIVVAAQGAALIAVLLSIKPWRRIRDVSLAVGVVGAASLALMLPISGPLWACLPKMRFVQFPWRYLFVLSFAVAVLFSCAVARAGRRSLLGQISAVVTCVGGAYYLFPSYLVAKRLAWVPFVTMRWRYVAGASAVLAAGALMAAVLRRSKSAWVFASLLVATALGGAAFGGVQPWSDLPGSQAWNSSRAAAPEYLPVATTLDSLPAVAESPLATVTCDSHCEAHVSVRTWDNERKTVVAGTDMASRMVFHVANYPTWIATVNGHGTPLYPDELGRVAVSLRPGVNTVELRMAHPRERVQGALLSIAVAAVVGLCRWFGASSHRGGSGEKRMAARA